MKRVVDFDHLESRMSFLPERLRSTAVCMFASPRRAAAWIGMMTANDIELAPKHQPSPDDLARLKAIYLEIFPNHDPDDGTHRMLSGVHMIGPCPPQTSSFRAG